MRDLEQVDVRKTVGQQRWVDGFLDVAHQEEPPLPDLTEQDDGDVVDAGASIRRRGGYVAAYRPEHAHLDLIDGESVA